MNVEAAEFIERHRYEPFFLYLSHYAVHTRLVGQPDRVAKYEAKPEAGPGNGARRNNPHLAAQLEAIDQGIGTVLSKLKELRLDEKTLVIFTSDNGGEDRVTSNAPLRAGKSTLYEGGIREPLLVRWPGVVPPGAVVATPIITLDFYPTLLDAAGISADPRQTLDGLSLLALLKDPRADLRRDALYWHYPLDQPHFLGGRSAGAVREGDWKLIEFYDTGQCELYHLADDVGEQHDLAAAMPERVKRLQHRLAAWRERVGDAGARDPGVRKNHGSRG
jgi:arylsulfatase A-like enzyme